MSLTASMWTGVSGLLAHGEKMNVVGNNIANVSTVGFKGQRMDFSDFVYQNSFSSAGVTQIGRGVKIGAVMGNFSTGPMETTSEATDLAINGRGFFQVKKTGSDQAFYTRAGNFRFNYEGYLTDPNGLAVQGWKVDNRGGVTQAAGGMNASTTTEKKSDIIGSGVPMDVKLDTWTVAPQQTTKITFKSQLPQEGSDKARDSTNPFAALFQIWDGTQPPATASTPPIAEQSYGYQTTMNVYDEGGTKHKVTIYYDRVDAEDYQSDPSRDMWEYMVTMDPADDQRMFADTTTNPPTLRKVNETKAGGVLMSGTMTFDKRGQIVSQSAYTWGGSDNPTDNPAAYSNVADPSNPAKTVQVINLDPSNLDNWRPAAISSNGYPLVVANFSGILDAQTAGSPNGEKYNIEMDFGLKAGNLTTPWENHNSLGSLSVPSYTRNPNHISGTTPAEGPEFVRLYSGYDPTVTDIYDPRHYQYLFDVPGHPNQPDYPLTDLGFLSDFKEVLLKYKGVTSINLKAGDLVNTVGAMQPPRDITVQLDPAGQIVAGQTFADGDSFTLTAGALGANLPPVDIEVKLNSDGTLLGGQMIPYTDGGTNGTFNLDAEIATYEGTAPNNFEADFVQAHRFNLSDAINAFNTAAAAAGTPNFETKFRKPLVDNALAKNPVVDSSVLTAATAANPNNLANLNKPIIYDSSLTTSYGDSPFNASQSQNGYGYGDLSSWSVDADGVLYGVYSNGVTLPLWQITLYDFTCTQGLRREGNNLFSQTRDSGEPKSGPAGVAGLGTINGQTLEQSNVDMSTEFVQMISTQRGFQSNSKIITTTDTMLDTVINMKR